MTSNAVQSAVLWAAAWLLVGQTACADCNERTLPQDRISVGRLSQDVLYEVGRDIANSHIWPHWNNDSEFKIVRDGSEEVREP
jgi:hypothetical protein